MIWLYSVNSIRKFLNSDFHRWWNSYDVSRMEFKLIDMNSVGLYYLSYSVYLNLFYSLDGSREFFCTRKIFLRRYIVCTK